MRRLWLLLILVFVVTGCASTASCSAQDASCIKVLFVGNSYTYVNDLPNTFAQLARSGGHKVEVGMAAQGGWTLSNHLQSSDTLNILNSKNWNYVVLQEQSEIPSVAQSRTQEMYPAARELVRRIQERRAMPLFFDTWAHRDGAPQYGMSTYQSMQAGIDTGYT